jgi:hypothetical protein
MQMKPYDRVLLPRPADYVPPLNGEFVKKRRKVACLVCRAKRIAVGPSSRIVAIIAVH